jgi:hypothetical protein
MLNPITKLFGSSVIAVLVCFGFSPGSAHATVFRDRAAFNAASQNLRTIDFEAPVKRVDGITLEIDGLTFANIGGMPEIFEQNGNKLLFGATVGEITRMTIFLPPGTTAVGLDQTSLPMIVQTSNGESVMMNQSDGSTFVGFVSDQPMQSLIITLDSPEPTPPVILDNLSYGQRRAGNEPPVPQLLVTTATGRALALDSVTKESEPFTVLSAHNFSSDGRRRITLFIVGVLLEPADVDFVTVEAENAQQVLFNLPVEATARVQNLTWMSQVTVRLPEALAGAGDVNVSVRVRGAVSNKAPLRID